MLTYIIRRIIYTLPIWIGVYGITFALFHMRDPIAIARVHMPQAPDAALKAWVRNNNLHLPRFVNLPADADTVPKRQARKANAC
jgi:ABC-type dipeptide/oligopeptide/nickel transport system permease component